MLLSFLTNRNGRTKDVYQQLVLLRFLVFFSNVTWGSSRWNQKKKKVGWDQSDGTRRFLLPNRWWFVMAVLRVFTPHVQSSKTLLSTGKESKKPPFKIHEMKRGAGGQSPVNNQRPLFLSNHISFTCGIALHMYNCTRSQMVKHFYPYTDCYHVNVEYFTEVNLKIFLLLKAAKLRKRIQFDGQIIWKIKSGANGLF